MDNDHKIEQASELHQPQHYKTSMCMNEILIPFVSALIGDINLQLHNRKLVQVNGRPIPDASLSSAVNRNIRAGS
jgi:hypothetical protein